MSGQQNASGTIQSEVWVTLPPLSVCETVSEGQKDLGRSRWADQDLERQRQLESQTSIETTKNTKHPINLPRSRVKLGCCINVSNAFWANMRYVSAYILLESLSIWWNIVKATAVCLCFVPPPTLNPTLEGILICIFERSWHGQWKEKNEEMKLFCYIT